MAVSKRRINKKLIFHSDRGIQYAFKTIEQAIIAIFEYIEIWYNRKRLCSFLGNKTPYEMEQEFYQLKD
ncbi:IS3 family transposase [Zunongwangia mangrovi]|uniref:IS3 family transposase n=1 Tax=Zunongwangia mangrovi TaxID=1334022 RepID=UPI000B862A2F|nr:IS3 family transposase [Zunongwangia mangrovi]